MDDKADRILARIEWLADLMNRRFDRLDQRLDQLFDRLQSIECDTDEVKTALAGIRSSLERMGQQVPSLICDIDDGEPPDTIGPPTSRTRH